MTNQSFFWLVIFINRSRSGFLYNKQGKFNTFILGERRMHSEDESKVIIIPFN